LAPFVLRAFPELFRHSGDAGIVDEEVDFPEPFHGGIGRSPDRPGVRYVRRNNLNLAEFA
jgi:hypothetical protein